ncbi:DEAD/DEAH box helicase [Candidatus Woesearchaeota archaeon]|nr:DEAD/DEAH box helicase [Candidatus Woesearchaeota archaeon]
MDISSLKEAIPEALYTVLLQQKHQELRPCQEKALGKGLLAGKNLLVCTPTGSGKTLVAELACTNAILTRRGKAVYIAPLKSLASEKYKQMTSRYGQLMRVALSIGDMDASDPYLAEYGFIITTSEKLDSLIRHGTPWLKEVAVVIIDEIHLLNDPGRGPTLEILITILRKILKDVQLIGLSATIGNPKELAAWLGAELIIDHWRPVELKKGIYFDGELVFDESHRSSEPVSESVRQDRDKKHKI